ncbi:4'-phosphopantetheinyl transferase family protein [Acuticoccus mangrovi]|uniref:4'-phosphopantetheinyl transferase superfamily protein n=1 Tax=Acuticoccus mangrovi TaxID=2796142 RepID=A0A934IVF6_9HYPH|nr:4'-phosphopantetheinyl transferase superfamily protein [Acuticoccus mangrovi]MBJ3778755.1 4'-phosphopantetheinyl transferase superfamily protein [Acuticoccus mangrovi]
MSTAVPRCAGEWHPFGAVPDRDFLSPGGVDVWSLGLSPELARRGSALLSADEHRRAALLRTARLRFRFVAARSLLRRILAAYLGEDPAALTFSAGPYGKPALVAGSGRPPLEFNLSHSGDRALLAVSNAGAVGVDIERIGETDLVEEVGPLVFTPKERLHLEEWPANARQAAFYGLWCRKEAIAKALGLGLSLDVARLEVGFLEAVTVDLENGEPFWFASLPVIEDHATALVFRHPAAFVRCFALAAWD